MPTITTVDATWDTGTAMDAGELRRADTAMFLGDGSNNGVRGGIVYHGPNSLAVAVNGSDQITVQAGAFVIPAATGLGVYRGALSATSPLVNITARNATNPRIDIVAIQVTGTNATVTTIDGTPSASPTVPVLPAQHIGLAYLVVPAVGGGAVAVDSAWRTFATSLGGTLPVPTAGRLPGSGNIANQRALAIDTGIEYVWNGAAWLIQKTESAAVTAGAAYVISTNTKASIRGGLAFVSVDAIATALVSVNDVLFTLGAGYRPAVTTYATLVTTNAEPLAVTINTSGTVTTQIQVISGRIIRGQFVVPI